MAYRAALEPGVQLWVQAVEAQTLLTLLHQSAGQQQAQSTQLETGEWTVPPSLFQVASGYVLRLESIQGQHFIQIQAGSLQALTTPPSLADAVAIALNPMSETEPTAPKGSTESAKGSFGSGVTPMQPIEPMQTLPPMTMGNMSMSQTPMRMRMGDMELTMGEPTTPDATRRFCPQCGSSIKAGDRFCTHCGHRLAEVKHG